MLQHPEPHLRGAGEIVSSVNWKTQVLVAPMNQIGIGEVAHVGVGQVETGWNWRALQPGDFKLRQVWATGGVGLHQASGDIAARGNAELRLVGEDHDAVLRPAVLAEIAGSGLKHGSEFWGEAAAVEFAE